MRFLAFAALLIAGCSKEPEPDRPPTAIRGPAAEVCSLKCCVGMHTYIPPSICEKCGTKEVPTWHHYCIACADSMGRCPHCGGKRPPPPKPDPQTDEPSAPSKTPPESKAPPPPPSIPAPAKQETPKGPAFNLDDVKGDKLPSEEAKPPGKAKVEHDLIVFACRASEFQEVLKRHLDKKGADDPQVHSRLDDLFLYVLWGDRLGEPKPEAVFDRAQRRIVVTARWSGAAMMDTGTEYRGHGFKLGPLETGEYGAWIREVTAVEKAEPKLTKTLTFTVRP